MKKGDTTEGDEGVEWWVEDWLAMSTGDVVSGHACPWPI
jgi:hypothetical protein